MLRISILLAALVNIPLIDPLMAFDGPVDPPGRKTAGPEASAPTASPVTDDRQVSLDQLICLRADFASHFNAGGTEIGPAYVDINWMNLKQKLDSVPVSGDTLRAISLRYGLQPSAAPNAYRLSLAVEILKIKPMGNDQWSVTPVAKRFYAVDSHGDLQRVAMSSWRDPDTYFAQVTVRRDDGGTMVPIDVLNDTRQYLVPWENELLGMRMDNPTCNAIRFSSIAEPDQWDGDVAKGMHHHVCAVALHGTTELINNDAVVTAHPYQNKAADLGNPCPVACGDAYFPAHGTLVRKCQ